MERHHIAIGPDPLKQFLIDTDRIIVDEINAAVVRLKSLKTELNQSAGDRHAQTTASDMINAVVRDTNRRMRQINREVRQRTKGHREDGPIHRMIELLNEQIRDAQSLMDRTVNDVRRSLRG